MESWRGWCFINSSFIHLWNSYYSSICQRTRTLSYWIVEKSRIRPISTWSRRLSFFLPRLPREQIRTSSFANKVFKQEPHVHILIHAFVRRQNRNRAQSWVSRCARYLWEPPTSLFLSFDSLSGWLSKQKRKLPFHSLRNGCRSRLFGWDESGEGVRERKNMHVGRLRGTFRGPRKPQI